jgi:ribosome modulation factor
MEIIPWDQSANQPYEEGHHAGLAGSSPGACPYVIFTEEWVAWLHCHTVDFWHC